VSAALIATGLGKRYRRVWALRDCSLEVPEGAVVGLVGPNGAGKTTLLQLAAGLLRPTTGRISVLGYEPGKLPLLPQVGFMAQDVPLYDSFTVGETLELGRRLNARWDDPSARDRLTQAGIPSDKKIGALSGGHRAQVALALAFGKRPRLLLLDEPLASLDPLARREFLQALMSGVADGGLTVILSSHLVGDLERVCDHLIVLSDSRTQVSGDISDLLSSHRVIIGPKSDSEKIAGVSSIVQRSDTDRQSTLLVRTDGPILDPNWSLHKVTLEDLVLAYLGRPGSAALPELRSVERDVEVSS
jgi:ABC-2 type transport system ATP-binding protein